MKRFLIFCGLDYYPSGGWSDFHAAFAKREEAEAEIARLRTEGQIYNADRPDLNTFAEIPDWIQLLDTETMECEDKSKA